MTDSIEAFVEKLHQDGVEAGKAEAGKLVSNAETKAADIVASAEKEATTIIARTEIRVKEIEEQSKSDLKLATRDTLLKLKDSLISTMNLILEKEAGAQLQDTEFLKSVIQEVAVKYVEADAVSTDSVVLNLTEEKQNQLCDWLQGDLKRVILGDRTDVTVHSALKKAGFEMSVGNGTVEFSDESIAELVKEMVGSQLKELME